MTMEQRITTLEEVSELLIAAQRDINATVRRFRSAQALYQEAMVEVAELLDRQDEVIQVLLSYVPITQAEIVRLDNRIDTIESA
jgi:hypothetical protein